MYIQCWPHADCDHVNTSQHLQEADKPADEGGGGPLVQALVGGGQQGGESGAGHHK